MKVLVTGGAGYIGSHTCKALALAGHAPVVYDNLSTGHRDLVRWGPFVHGDILDTPLLMQTMRDYRIEGVIHFAALAQVGESVLHPAIYYKNNITGTQSILEAMRLSGVGRIVVSSTCAVYGQPEASPIRESCPKQPINPYGRTKLLMEDMLRDYSAAYGITGAALRYFNAAGCDAEGETGERHQPESHLIPRVIMASRGLIPALHIFGNDYPTPDGTCIRDYVHVADLADAHLRALLHAPGSREVIAVNLGTGTGFSVREIVDTAAKVLGRPVPHEWSPKRAGDPPALVADAGEAKSLLGWVPAHSSLEHILRTADNWCAKDT